MSTPSLAVSVLIQVLISASSDISPAMISSASLIAVSASFTSCSSFKYLSASSRTETVASCDMIYVASPSSPFSLAIIARVRLFGLYGLYISSTATTVSACSSLARSSSVNFPWDSIDEITVCFLSSSERRYLSLSSKRLRISSSSAPVASFRYLAMKGIVFPSSMRLITASACQCLIPSSSVIFCVMSILIQHAAI